MGDPPAPGRAARGPLTSAARAHALLLAAVARPRRELVGLDQALGRVLAGPLLANEDVPGLARSMVDGFGVRAADIAGASPATPADLQLAGRVKMGEPPDFTVGPGQAGEIPTGGAVPGGVDTVVMLEEVTATAESRVLVRAALPLGRNLLRQGEDLADGQLVLAAGRRLGAREVAALALFGVSGVAVTARPRVAVLSSGSELRPASQARQAAQVRDLNLPALAVAAEAAGALVTRAGIVADEPDILSRRLQELAADHDLVIITGGSSVGVRDFAEAAVGAAGGSLLFHGLDIRPGRPVLAARLGVALVVGLPGVPAAALTLFQIFLRPLLASMAGELAAHVPWRARLASPVTSRAGREDYLRVRLELRGVIPGEAPGELWAWPLAGGPALLSTLLAADALLVVPAERLALAAGEMVELVSLT